MSRDYFKKAFNLAIRRKKPRIDMDLKRMMRTEIMRNVAVGNEDHEDVLNSRYQEMLKETRNMLFQGVDDCAEISEYLQKNGD